METRETQESPNLKDDEFFVLLDIYRNPGRFNAFYKPKITKRLELLGFIEITFPFGYDEGYLRATQAAEEWFLSEKAKLENSENA